MNGTNVARLPRRYAMLHFKTPRPVFEFANVQACCAYSLAVLTSRELVLCFGPRLFPPMRGDRSFVSASCEPSKAGGGPKVTFLFTRRPVLGRMRVA